MKPHLSLQETLLLDLEEEEEEDPSNDGTTPNASAPATPLQPVVQASGPSEEKSSVNEVIPFVAPPTSPRNRRPSAGWNRRPSLKRASLEGLVDEVPVTFAMMEALLVPRRLSPVMTLAGL